MSSAVAFGIHMEIDAPTLPLEMDIDLPTYLDSDYQPTFENPLNSVILPPPTPFHLCKPPSGEQLLTLAFSSLSISPSPPSMSPPPYTLPPSPQYISFPLSISPLPSALPTPPITPPLLSNPFARAVQDMQKQRDSPRSRRQGKNKKRGGQQSSKKQRADGDTEMSDAPSNVERRNPFADAILPRNR